MEVYTQDQLDKEMYERYSLNNRVNNAEIKKSNFVRLLAYSIVIFAVYMIKNELFNYPLSSDLSFIFTVSAFIIIVPIHELIHFITSRKLGYKPKLHLFRNTLEEAIKKEDLIIIVLSPVVIISFLLLVLMVIFPTYIPLITLLLGAHLVGCINDISQYNTIKNFEKGCYIGVDKNEYRGYL